MVESKIKKKAQTKLLVRSTLKSRDFISNHMLFHLVSHTTHLVTGELFCISKVSVWGMQVIPATLYTLLHHIQAMVVYFCLIFSN